MDQQSWLRSVDWLDSLTVSYPEHSCTFYMAFGDTRALTLRFPSTQFTARARKGHSWERSPQLLYPKHLFSRSHLILYSICLLKLCWQLYLVAAAANWCYSVMYVLLATGGVELCLSKMPRGAKSAKSCGLHQLSKDGSIPTMSIFRNRRCRGWWPMVADSEEESGEQEVTVRHILLLLRTLSVSSMFFG